MYNQPCSRRFHSFGIKNVCTPGNFQYVQMCGNPPRCCVVDIFLISAFNLKFHFWTLILRLGTPRGVQILETRSHVVPSNWGHSLHDVWNAEVTPHISGKLVQSRGTHQFLFKGAVMWRLSVGKKPVRMRKIFVRGCDVRRSLCEISGFRRRVPEAFALRR